MQTSSALLLTSFILFETGLSSPYLGINALEPRRGGGGHSSGGSSSGSSSGSSTSSTSVWKSVGNWFVRHKALVIGVGVAILILLALTIWWCCWRRRKNKRITVVTQAQEPYKPYPLPGQTQYQNTSYGQNRW